MGCKTPRYKWSRFYWTSFTNSRVTLTKTSSPLTAGIQKATECNIHWKFYNTRAGWGTEINLSHCCPTGPLRATCNLWGFKFQLPDSHSAAASHCSNSQCLWALRHFSSYHFFPLPQGAGQVRAGQYSVAKWGRVQTACSGESGKCARGSSVGSCSQGQALQQCRSITLAQGQSNSGGVTNAVLGMEVPAKNSKEGASMQCMTHSLTSAAYGMHDSLHSQKLDSLDLSQYHLFQWMRLMKWQNIECLLYFFMWKGKVFPTYKTTLSQRLTWRCKYQISVQEWNPGINIITLSLTSRSFKSYYKSWDRKASKSL